MEFVHYYRKNRRKNNRVVQSNVSTNKTVIKKFRITEELDYKIKEKCKEKGKSFSELNRILWEAYFETEKNIAWREEVENW